MRNVEVLSPAGDLKSFYKAIECGADAVYIGLNKFNARMKAENINDDNLEELVSFAHLKNVKVYVTLNTLLTTNEIVQVVDLVGICLDAQVDAFIVQDLGLISVLKKVYPEIVLHGSTQLGIHNVRGARVAKKLGLSRIVLSRECELQDILEISKNVDIELEVFVQGALCVCFSGNCYLSSIKHNASGNRGECKQLCRLPYKLSDGKSSLQGYPLSPRDICNIEYLEKLIKAGVVSFKIEGRLRHSGYVGIATNVYKKAVTDILNNSSIDCGQAKKDLSKVFARGDYIPGYFEGNNVIGAKDSIHLGEKIGKCVDCVRFKDLYKIKLDVNRKLVCGDGLRFVDSNSSISLGVGNVEYDGNYTYVYGKNYISKGSNVYLTLDKLFEDNFQDLSCYIKLDMQLNAYVGNSIELICKCKEENFSILGDVCQSAKTAPITIDTINKQLMKFDDKIFRVDLKVDMEDVFLPVQSLKQLYKKLSDEIYSRLLKKKVYSKNALPDIIGCDSTYTRLAIVNEGNNISNLKNYDALIFSPKNFSINEIKEFQKKYKKFFNASLIINLPIVSRFDDMFVVDNVVDAFKDAIFIANNIYALDYLDKGVEVFAGFGLNVSNDYTASLLNVLGVKEIFSNIEKWCPTIKNTYKLTQGYYSLMTMAHCPFKTLYNNDCSNCKENGSMTNVGDYKVRRLKVARCYFELIDNKSFSGEYYHSVEDLRR